MTLGPAAVSALDSTVLGPLHTSGELREVLGESGLLERFVQTEAALATAQADVGLIPPEAATQLGLLSVDDLDLARLADRASEVGYPIVGLVEQLAEIIPDDLGRYVHWGATTQDIMDTALVLQIRDALDLIEADLLALAQGLHRLAETHRDTSVVGRSQLQQALPTTFGHRAAGWLSPLLRHLDRLAELRPRVEVVQLGGAVGTLASMAPHGVTVRAKLAEQLGLGDPSTSWHSSRDRLVEVVAWAAQVSSSLAKIGLDVSLSAQTEVTELNEGSFGASSAMPHKRNPILSQQLIRAARLTRTHLDLALDSAVADYDRATAAWSLEWNAIAPALAVAGGAVTAGVDLIAGLRVNATAMADNLDRTGGLILAEAVMMHLAPQLGRQRAHDTVAAMVARSLETDRSFAEIVAADAPDAWSTLDPTTYMGHAGDHVDAVLAAAARRFGPLAPVSPPPNEVTSERTRSS
ncbi:MAG: class-II fumarase/aspartase family protein [Acidimicrobiales bacterium]